MRGPVLAACGLIGACRGGSPAPACDAARLGGGVEQLALAEPALRPMVAAQAIEKACADRLPHGLRVFLRLVLAHTRGGPLPSGDEVVRAEQAELFARACPGDDARLRAALASPPAERTSLLYDLCELSRFGVVDRAELTPDFGATPAAWAVHAWLLEQGVETGAAQALTRALLLFEPWHLGAVPLRPDLHLPRSSTARPLPAAGLVLQVGPDRVLLGGREVGELADGRLSEPADALRAALAGAGPPADPGSAPLFLAADRTAQAAALARVAAVAYDSGWSEIWLVALRPSETSPYGGFPVAWQVPGTPDPVPDPQLDPRVLAIAAEASLEQVVAALEARPAGGDVYLLGLGPG